MQRSFSISLWLRLVEVSEVGWFVGVESSGFGCVLPEVSPVSFLSSLVGRGGSSPTGVVVVAEVAFASMTRSPAAPLPLGMSWSG